MKCKSCEKEFIPRQKYCCSKCRVYASRGKSVTDSLHGDVITKEIVESEMVPSKGNRKIFNTAMCKEHQVFFGTCGCE